MRSSQKKLQPQKQRRMKVGKVNKFLNIEGPIAVYFDQKMVAGPNLIFCKFFLFFASF